MYTTSAKIIMYAARAVWVHGYKIAAVLAVMALLAAHAWSPWWVVATVPAVVIAAVTRICRTDSPL